MKIENCPYCQSKELVKVFTPLDYSYSNEEFEIQDCKSCNFRFTSNPPSEANAYKYYQGDNYISHSDTKKGLVDRVYHTVREWMLEMKFRKVSKYIKGKRVLDLGSGTGYFLNHLKNKGFEVEGIEMSEAARALSIKKFNIEANPPSTFFDLKEKSIDAITMWHVLEHLYDLPKYFIQFNKVLVNNGYLFIAVPNYESFEAQHYGEKWAAYDVPRHLWHFTPSSMANWGEEYGFKLVNKYKMPFDPFYNALLSEGYNKALLKMPKAVLIGGISLLNSLFNVDKSSSLIYVFEKIK